MSHVTNVLVLAGPLADELVGEALDRVWEELDLVGIESPPKLVPPNATGGRKNLECEVFVGAHNYFPVQAFITSLGAAIAVWPHGQDEVQLLIRDQHDDRFTLYEYDAITHRFIKL